MEAIEQLAIVPVNSALLKSILEGYKSPKNKIASLEKEGKIVRLKKGLYVVSPKVSKNLLSVELIANHIYGPSYVSMQSALRYYGLIPERVFAVRSSTIRERSKTFKNEIATFDYVSFNEDYYSIGIVQREFNDKYTFLIASPEKALCDLIISTPKLKFQSVKSLEIYLRDDIRFDMSKFWKMDKTIIQLCSQTGKKSESLKILLKLLSK